MEAEDSDAREPLAPNREGDEEGAEEALAEGSEAPAEPTITPSRAAYSTGALKTSLTSCNHRMRESVALRVAVGVALVILAAVLGGIAGALFDRQANARVPPPVAPAPVAPVSSVTEGPPPPSEPPASPATEPVAPQPSPQVSPQPSPQASPPAGPVASQASPPPSAQAGEPSPPILSPPPSPSAPPPGHTRPAPSPAPSPEVFPPSPPSPPPLPPSEASNVIVPEGEQPPPRPVCHFRTPSHAKDPTAKTPGMDYDRMRRVVFANECDGDLMVNIQGFTYWDTGRWYMQNLPHDGGFPLKAGEEVEKTISERLFSGRIWARPNCRSPCNIVSCGNPHNKKASCTFRNGSRVPDCVRDGLWCDTGNCPGGNDTTCRGQAGEFIGGLPPGPLLELTLCGGRGARIECYKDGPAYNAKKCESAPNQDYYDVSNVDGTSKIWAGMEVIRGRRLVGKAAPEDRFNCGRASMPGQFNMSWCPQPMRIARNDSDPHGYTANASVADAVGCLSACNFMSQVAFAAPGQPKSPWIADRRRANNHSEVAEQDDVSGVTAADVARTCCECGHGADRGICPAPLVSDTGKVTWPPANMACIAGCSPYSNYPASYEPTMCHLEKMPAIRANDKDEIELSEVQAIFKKWAPGAYSWQFDDLSSTYLCESADYKLTFCPRT